MTTIHVTYKQYLQVCCDTPSILECVQTSEYEDQTSILFTSSPHLHSTHMTLSDGSNTHKSVLIFW